MAHCHPNLLATSSYDGQVIVWNMVSGHIFTHLTATKPPGYEDTSCKLTSIFLEFIVEDFFNHILEIEAEPIIVDFLSVIS